MKSIWIRPIETAEALEQAFAVRRTVFVQEQQVPTELEYDEYENTARHYLAGSGDEAIGTARWRETDKGVKLERFAVLPEYRGIGAGKALLDAVLREVLPLKKPIYLHAQIQVVPFYQQAGFETEGDIFEEAGILHYKMKYKG